MAKKRICLIGRELGSDGQDGGYLQDEGLNEVLEWAYRNGFDGVGVLSAGLGIVEGEAATQLEARMLASMPTKARTEWAKRVCDQAVARWNLGKAPAELVLLCGLKGYQELAEALQERLPAISVTRPLAGTGVARRARGLVDSKVRPTTSPGLAG